MYTIEDLKSKYVKVGTPEAEVFLDACEKLGITWADGKKPREFSKISNCICVNKFGDITYICESYYSNNPDFSLFTTKQQWSIYTNDKPLCELSNEQAAELFNAWRGGEVRRTKDDYGWCDLPVKATAWFDDNIYRIKQKSERELFVEAAMQLMTSETERTLEQQFGALFDSGKFKLVKDGEL